MIIPDSHVILLTGLGWTPGPVFTKLFRFRIKIRLKFQNK